jgi:hypothetical protein
MIKERNETKTIKETPALRRLGPSVLAGLSANKATFAALALLLGGGLTILAAGTDRVDSWENLTEGGGGFGMVDA